MAGARISPQKSTAESTTYLFDRAEALSRVDGDVELLASLIDICFTEAMTARAMKGVRESWIEVGMDNKISKPIHRKEFNEVIVRNLVRKPILTPITARATADRL